LLGKAQLLTDAKLAAEGKANDFGVDRILHEANLADAVFDRSSTATPCAIASISVHPDSPRTLDPRFLRRPNRRTRSAVRRFVGDRIVTSRECREQAEFCKRSRAREEWEKLHAVRVRVIDLCPVCLAKVT
jgi:hypothetical protein